MILTHPKDLVPEFFDDTAQTYDKVVAWATFGKDHYWKKQIIEQIKHAESILDLACGTGILTRQIATKFPKSIVTGVDMTKSYLDIAKINSKDFSNILFVHQDAEELNLQETFDCICSSYIPKYCNPEILIKKCKNHLTLGGKIILHDFTYPKNKMIGKLWDYYFILLNIIGLGIPSWKVALKKLPQLIKSSSWVETYTKEFEQNGFDVIKKNLTWNSSIILVATLRSK